jgi:formylglycine-generating enzyme required for sulfatase activity
VAGYRSFHPAFAYLFNSYYEGSGPATPGPSAASCRAPGWPRWPTYRATSTEAMTRLLGTGLTSELSDLVELGLHHEQQHQELLLMDIKHVLSCNPCSPAYPPSPWPSRRAETPVRWIEHDGRSGRGGPRRSGFGFDNESPRHAVHLEPFALADRAVTCGEWMAFMADGGYSVPICGCPTAGPRPRPTPGRAPLYWFRVVDDWWLFTSGRSPAGGPGRARLPRELLRGRRLRPLERGPAAHRVRMGGRDLGTVRDFGARGGSSTPPSSIPVRPTDAPSLFGDVWQWTSSAYSPYPGFQPAAGRRRRVQREVHGQPVRAARRRLRDTPSTTSGPPTGTSSRRRRAGPSPDSAWPATADSRVHRRRTGSIDVYLTGDDLRAALERDVRAGLTAGPNGCRRCGSTTTGAVPCSTRSPGWRSTTRPGPSAALLQAHAPEIARRSGADTLVELGAGTCDKSRVLLDALLGAGTLRRYVPLDVSDTTLWTAATALADEYPGLVVHAVVGDFDHHIVRIPIGGRRMVAFLGARSATSTPTIAVVSSSTSTAP